MPRVLALFILVLSSLAGAQGLQKRLAHRAEAEALVGQLLVGERMEQALARLRYLGEERFAAEMLGQYVRAVNERQRRNVAFALAGLGVAESEPLLARLARDSDPVVRMSAAAGLGKVRSRNARVLVPLLSDPTLGVRREAARAIGAMRSARMGKLLAEKARVEGEPEVRAALLVAVGDSGDRRQAGVLETFLKSSSESARFAAAQGLCRLGAPRGLAFARALLQSQDRYERRQGLAVLEGAPARVARPLLKPLLDGPDRTLAAAAARLLHQGGERGMLEWLVLAAHHARGDEKLALEVELEQLHLSDEARKAILLKAGIR